MSAARSNKRVSRSENFKLWQTPWGLSGYGARKRGIQAGSRVTSLIRLEFNDAAVHSELARYRRRPGVSRKHPDRRSLNLTTTPGSVNNRNSFKAKHALWIVFGLMTVVVIYSRDWALLDPNSDLRQRYAAIPLLMLLHGVPGALALFLGFSQFSSRLRQRYLRLHRAMGRIYVGSVAIAAPLGVVVAVALPVPTLTPAAVIQAVGWLVATATGLYCVRTGNIQQHREWMMRSYPFAMVFIVVRAILAIPAIAQTGELGLATVVWSAIATACFLPSFVIAWQTLAASRRTGSRT